ncbi:ferrochelatase [Nigerium massiliense]|uniref:ferrochelatase n=1 Tax=Nigerium massiliense TaxID=1522317 RepID=UPI00058F9DEA|nr:ferrochelatase [Nigerium massiliense]
MGGLAPYDAILVASYGGPEGPDDVLPFMRNATGGRGIPDERLLEVSGHYQRFGGRSPINERNAELMDALGAELRHRGIDVPIVIGNRNWHPFFTETLRDLDASGAKRVLVLITAAYKSYSSCRQYRENLAAALDELDSPISIDRVGPYAETEGFVRATIANVEDALGLFGDEVRPGVRVLFVTHSIPTAMNEGTDPDPDGSYAAQHQRVAERVVAGLTPRLGFEPRWEIAYCSRSGAPHIPWLEPDVNDRLEELAADGVREVITVPFGFVNDHMEVVYDLDTEAKATADGLGLHYVRAATVGTHPAFIAELADRVEQRAAIARGEVPFDAADHLLCPPDHCLSRPGAPTLPAVCEDDR